MRKHWRYLKYLLRHKWYVLVECWKLGIPLQGITHDLSKFRPSEWGPYVEQFYGNKKHPSITRLFFDEAWLHHQHRNPHHWQYWILREDNPQSDWAVWAHQPEVGPYYLVYKQEQVAAFVLQDGDDTSDKAFRAMRIVEKAVKDSEVKVMPMPDNYRREMLADWRGAGKALGNPDTLAWYVKNRDQMKLHYTTQEWIEQQLGYKARPAFQVSPLTVAAK